MRDLNSDEKKWCKRLEKCLNDMPTGLEIMVIESGSILVMELGQTDVYFSNHGHTDDPEYLEVILPKTKDRIDGRDNGI